MKPPLYPPAIQAQIDAFTAGEVVRPKRHNRHPEDDLQKQIVATLTLLTIPPARFWWVPNGQNLSKAAAGRSKAMGLTPGVVDLHFAWHVPRRPDMPNLYLGPCPWGALFGVIELKSAVGSLEPEQKAFLADMAALGHRTAVARSLEAVLDTLTGWGYPLRRALL